MSYNASPFESLMMLVRVTQSTTEPAPVTGSNYLRSRRTRVISVNALQGRPRRRAPRFAAWQRRRERATAVHGSAKSTVYSSHPRAIAVPLRAYTARSAQAGCDTNLTRFGNSNENSVFGLRVGAPASSSV